MRSFTLGCILYFKVKLFAYYGKYCKGIIVSKMGILHNLWLKGSRKCWEILLLDNVKTYLKPLDKGKVFEFSTESNVENMENQGGKPCVYKGKSVFICGNVENPC